MANYFVILSEAKNLSSIEREEKKERFFASLRMTKSTGMQGRMAIKGKGVAKE
jgi:hypothetical protein